MPNNAQRQLSVRHLASAAAITLIALTGCSSTDDGQGSKIERTTTPTATATATATVKESQGTLLGEDVQPIDIPKTASKINVRVSCISEYPGVVTLADQASGESLTYVIPSLRSADTYPREVVEQLYADDDTVHVVDEFEVELSNKFPVENYFTVNIGTGEVTKPDDYCTIRVETPTSPNFLSESIEIAPNGEGKIFTFKFPPAAPAPAPAPAPTGPGTAGFSDGTYLVGTDIAPGTYRAPGGSACYYARLSNLSGEFNAIISNGLGVSPVITVAESDAAFSSRHCGQWQSVE